MTCKHCGADVPRGIAFCPSCGQPVAVRKGAPEVGEGALSAAVLPDEALAADEAAIADEPAAPDAPASSAPSPRPESLARGGTGPEGGPVPWYATTAGRIGIGVAALALVAGIGFGISRCTAAPQGASAPSAQQQAAQTGGASATGPASSAQPVQSDSLTKTYGEGITEDVWADRMHDENGIPTVRALLELSGAELETMLQAKGWFFDESGEWLSTGVDAGLSITGTAGRYNDDTIATFANNATGMPAAYLLSVSSKAYATPEEAITALGQVTVANSGWAGDTGVYVVYGPSKRENLLMVLPDDGTGTYAILTFNPESIEAGLFDDLTGGTYGKTPQEAFDNLFGKQLQDLSGSEGEAGQDAVE